MRVLAAEVEYKAISERRLHVASDRLGDSAVRVAGIRDEKV